MKIFHIIHCFHVCALVDENGHCRQLTCICCHHQRGLASLHFAFQWSNHVKVSSHAFTHHVSALDIGTAFQQIRDGSIAALVSRRVQRSESILLNHKTNKNKGQSTDCAALTFAWRFKSYPMSNKYFTILRLSFAQARCRSVRPSYHTTRYKQVNPQQLRERGHTISGSFRVALFRTR